MGLWKFIVEKDDWIRGIRLIVKLMVFVVLLSSAYDGWKDYRYFINTYNLQPMEVASGYSNNCVQVMFSPSLYPTDGFDYQYCKGEVFKNSNTAAVNGINKVNDTFWLLLMIQIGIFLLDNLIFSFAESRVTGKDFGKRLKRNLVHSFWFINLPKYIKVEE